MSISGEHPNTRGQHCHYFLQEGYGVNVVITSIGRGPPLAADCPLQRDIAADHRLFYTKAPLASNIDQVRT